MTNSTEKSLYETLFPCKDGVCDQCREWIYYNEPSYCQRKRNKNFSIHIQSEIEQNKIKLTMTKTYCGIDRMNLKDELGICDDGNILSSKANLLKIGKLLGVKSKTWD